MQAFRIWEVTWLAMAFATGLFGALAFRWRAAWRRVVSERAQQVALLDELRLELEKHRAARAELDTVRGVIAAERADIDGQKALYRRLAIAQDMARNAAEEPFADWRAAMTLNCALAALLVFTEDELLSVLRPLADMGEGVATEPELRVARWWGVLVRDLERYDPYEHARAPKRWNRERLARRVNETIRGVNGGAIAELKAAATAAPSQVTPPDPT